MTTTVFIPVQARQAPPMPGATASGCVPHPAHRAGDALRAAKVYVTAAFGVTVLGEHFEEAGIIKHR